MAAALRLMCGTACALSPARNEGAADATWMPQNCRRLAVAGAFHTSYMQPAVEKLQAALAATTIVTPRIPVISNVDAQPHSDPEVIKQILAKQVGGSIAAGLPLCTAAHACKLRGGVPGGGAAAHSCAHATAPHR